MIQREHYVTKVRPFYESDLIKIITGIRRCGKSVIFNQIINEVRVTSDNVIYLNFEDIRTSMMIQNVNDLFAYIDSHRKEGKCYLFFDEIQTLQGWQDACKTLRLHNNSVFITGSNSKLLSGEFVKELSGRYISIRIRPFVYKEICEYCQQLGKTPSVSDYLIWGGFPKRFEFDTFDAQIQYLSDLDNTIVMNDIINRYKIRKTDLFRHLVNFVLQSNARIYSVKSIHDYIKNAHSNCSVNTIMSYLSYLEEAFVIESIGQYSTKTKQELAFYKKIYNADVAFNSLRCNSNRYDITHNLENIVYNELLYRGYSLQVYNGDKEIDFMAQKDNKTYFVQVAYSVADEKAYAREFSAFDKIDNRHQKVLITNDDVDYSTSVVRHISLPEFLQMDEL
ncbi:MAG: ATP-binding protein [Bacteroidales bacterium]|nr:ATP-binding protein [Bacteroidales bacterium]